MKKEDLKNGSILETRSGEHCVVIGNNLYFIESGLETTLYRFDDNLKEIEGGEDDIMKVCIDPMKSNEWDWEREEPIQLTDDERAFLKMLNPKWKWIAKDSMYNLHLYEDKPIKAKGYIVWRVLNGDYMNINRLLSIRMFQFIKWEDKKPYNIQELLEGSED